MNTETRGVESGVQIERHNPVPRVRNAEPRGEECRIQREGMQNPEGRYVEFRGEECGI